MPKTISPVLHFHFFALVGVLLLAILPALPSHSLAQDAVSACGDGACSEEETCSTCFQDCGLCTPFTATKQEPGICGNVVCTVDEDCGSCPGDCGKCPEIEDVRQSARRLQILLARRENSTLEKRFSEEERKKIQELESAEKLDFWTRGRVTSVLRALQRAIKEETEALANNVFALLQSAVLRERWPILNLNKIAQALVEQNVQELLVLFPPSTEDLRALSQELEQIVEAFDEEVPLQSSPSGGFFGKVFAAEEPQGLDPKERFQKAVSLLQRMTEQGRDPRTVLPLLEERLAYLIARKDIIGVERSLRQVGEGARSDSLQELLALLEMMHVIQNEAKFQTLDASFAQAVRNVRSGAGRLHASLSVSGRSPQAEAAAVLRREGEQGIIDALAEEDLRVQKQTLSLLLQRERFKIENLLGGLEEEPKGTFSERLQITEQKLDDAATSTDLRGALEEWNGIARDMQDALRAEKGLFLRLIYLLQDFFGRS